MTPKKYSDRDSDGAALLKRLGFGQICNHLDKYEEELSQARKLIAELVETIKDINEHESGCIGAYEGREIQCRCLHRFAREVLSNNKDLIEKLTKE